MKLVGLLLIAAVCVLSGIRKSGELSCRVSRLEAALSLVRYIAAKIRYSETPVLRLLEAAGEMEEYRGLGFIHTCCRLCREGAAFPEAWSRAVQEKETALSDSDLHILLSFGKSLGTTDAAGQLQNCALHEELLSTALASAREDQAKRGRLYVNLGVLAGVAVVIVLL